MKILHVVPSYLPATRYGGPIHSVHGLCKALVAAGHEVTVFTTNVDGPDDSDVPLGEAVDLDGVQVWYFPSTWLRRLYWAPRMMQPLRQQISGFDIVHLHSVFLWPTWAAARAARKAGVSYLIAPRGMLVRDLLNKKSRWLKTTWIRLIERRNLEWASGIHVTAPLEQQEIDQFVFRLPAFYYVPNGIEPPTLETLAAQKSELVPDFPYVLFLSRINWKKGLDRLMRAWKDVPGAQLIVAGNDEENYQQEIQRIADAEGVASRVHFVGPVAGADKWLLYRNAELFVLPSHSENFGIVVLEAMAMGCPVVVTPEVGLAQTVADADCGRVVDGEPAALAEAIKELLAQPERRASMARKGRETALRDFSWGGVAGRMEAAYGDVLQAETTAR